MGWRGQRAPPHPRIQPRRLTAKKAPHAPPHTHPVLPMPSQFDRLVADLQELDEIRGCARQQQIAYQRQRQRRRASAAALAKAITTPPADFSRIQREQTRLQKAIAADHERRNRQQCAAIIARLTAAAKAGRLTGAQGGRLDSLRGRFGAMTPFTPPYPTSPRAA